MGYELIITEKPNAATKIAAALANGKPIREGKAGVYYYNITRGNKDLIVTSAVGHLYTVSEDEKKKKKGWTYPVFDIEWVEAAKARKDAAFTKKYVTNIRKLAKSAESFTVATDYDIEGEVIGLNVVRYACKQKDANRMKFSTLTKDELVRAYENKSKTLDWGQANAGETRHFLDWMYGINLSRALTLSIKAALGRHKILSSGRVQGPALKIIVDKEKEIQAFKPDPYRDLEITGTLNGADILGIHKDNPFWEKDKAQSTFDKINKEKEGKVADISKREIKQAPPTPFDLTTLQTEAYRTLKIAPTKTLELAQALYLEGVISYPRTSSQQLPPEIGFKKILTALLKQESYSKEAGFLLDKKTLTPNNGKKKDPAHPAIYPTGIASSAKDKERQLYDLIVRRFMATFGDPATRETVKIQVDVKEEPFIVKGTRTTVAGWHKLYGKYVTQKEEELPASEVGDKVSIKEILMHDKETQPPKRYTPASIIKELEKKGLGTKATRANIVDNLFSRGYVDDAKSIKATELGIKTVATLNKYSPTILDEELTRNFEIEMEKIREGKKTEEEVLSDAKKVLTKLLEDFKSNEEKIGKELGEATEETDRKMSTIGKCPACKEGTLVIKRGKFGLFIACDKYPDCTATFKLPGGALCKPITDKVCPECNYPMILVIRRGKRPMELCINPDCKSKQEEEGGVDTSKLPEDKGPCPKCGKGTMVLRKSFYGSFYGCSNYPKCKHIINLDGSTNDGAGSPAKKGKAVKKKATKKKPAKKSTSSKSKVKKETVINSTDL